MTERPKLDLKRSLNSTLVLIAAMLASSARDEGEKALQPLAEGIFGLDDPSVNANVDKLIEQGYLALDDKGSVRMTGFGEKVCLQATQNTPNFNRLATQNANTAFAMLFAAFTALRDVHLVNQPQIVSGANGSTLVDNLNELLTYFQSKLQPIAVAKKTTKKAPILEPA